MIHAKEIGFQSAWQELTPGGEIYEGGTSVQTITGEWRVNRPVFHPEKCKQCQMCIRDRYHRSAERVKWKLPMTSVYDHGASRWYRHRHTKQ